MERERVKPCSRCGETKPLSHFSPDYRHNVGRQSHCKPCKAAGERERRQRRGDHIRALEREQYRRNPQRHKLTDLKWKYGITPDEFRRKVEQQDGRCEICGVPFAEVARGANVDHCHTTGAVRGLLCGPCNRGLEPIERPGFVEAARAYLARHRAKAS